MLRPLISSILGGIQPSRYLGSEGQYLRSISVDPNFDLDGLLGGAIYPTKFSEFSGANLSDIPYGVITNPVTAQVFAFGNSSDDIVTYDEDLANESTLTSTIFQNGWYYANYIYYMAQASSGSGWVLKRYGPLTAAAGSRTNDDVTSEMWSVSRVDNGPNRLQIEGVQIPVFAGHVHENALYISHFRSGVAVVSKVETAPGLNYDTQTGNFTVGNTLTGGTSGATAVILDDIDSGTSGTLILGSITGEFQNNETITDGSGGSADANGTLIEGVGNISSALSVLSLPANLVITDIGSVASDIGILAMPGSTFDATADPSTKLRQGVSKFFVWDGSSDSWYRPIDLEVAYASAIENSNGAVLIFAGDVGKGTNILTYEGGTTLRQVAYLPFSTPPFSTATQNIGNRVVFSGNDLINGNPCVYSIGTQDVRLGQWPIHCIGRPSNADADIITCIGQVQQTAALRPEIIIGWVEDEGGANEDYGLDKLSTGDAGAVLHSAMVNVGQHFTINTVLIPLATALAANMELVVKIYTDNGSSNQTIGTINTTNFAAGTQFIRLECAVEGNVNFYLSFEWNGTVALPLAYPISADINISPT